MKIEYPKLKKIGGFKKVALKIVIRAIVIILISSLVGGLSGYIVQKSFSNLTGYNKKAIAITAPQTADGNQNIKNSEAKQENSNPYIKSITDTTSSAIKAVTESDIVQKINEMTVGKIITAFKPVTDSVNGLLRAIYLAAFWLPFILMFIITAWFANKIISAKRFLTNGTDTQVIRNMEILEAKVKELVDHANGELVYKAVGKKD